MREEGGVKGAGGRNMKVALNKSIVQLLLGLKTMSTPEAWCARKASVHIQLLVNRLSDLMYCAANAKQCELAHVPKAHKPTVCMHSLHLYCKKQGQKQQGQKQQRKGSKMTAMCQSLSGAMYSCLQW